MNILEVKIQLEKIPLLGGFNFEEPKEDSLFATLEVPPRHTKEKGGSEIITGNRYYLFCAHMYKGERREFFYLTIYRNDRLRHYRCRTWQNLESNKIFSSGTTVKKLIESLNAWIKSGYSFNNQITWTKQN